MIEKTMIIYDKVYKVKFDDVVENNDINDSSVKESIIKENSNFQI